MDDFSICGNYFYEVIENIEKILVRCQENNLALSNEKIWMLFASGVVLGQVISQDGIDIDPTKLRQLKISLFLKHRESSKVFLAMLAIMGALLKISLKWLHLFLNVLRNMLNSNGIIIFNVILKLSSQSCQWHPFWVDQVSLSLSIFFWCIW